MDLITFECTSCRQILKVGMDKAGRPAKCPRCGTALQIPMASMPEPEPLTAAAHEDDEIEEIKPIRKGGAARNRDDDDDRPRKRRRDEADDDDDDRPRKRRRDEEDDADDDRPRRRRRRDEEDNDDDRPRKRRRDEDDDDDYDRPRKKRGGMRPSDRWPKVQVGILIVAIAACVMTATWALYLITDLLSLIALIIASSGGMSAGGWLNTASVFMKIAVIVGLLAGVGGIVGYVFNVFVPNKRGAMGMAIATLALGVIELTLDIIFRVIPTFKALQGFLAIGEVVLFFHYGEIAGLIFGLVYWLIFGAVFILLFLLMGNIGTQWKQRGHAQDCTNLLIIVAVGSGLVLLSILMSYIAFKSVSGPQTGIPAMVWVSLVLKLLGDIALVGTFAWSIPVLFRTKDVID